LARLALVVLVPFRAGRQLEPVDPERLHTEPPAHEANRAARARSFDLVDVHDAVAYAGEA
jgi:hypothetical protein